MIGSWIHHRIGCVLTVFAILWEIYRSRLTFRVGGRVQPSGGQADVPTLLLADSSSTDRTPCKLAPYNQMFTYVGTKCAKALFEVAASLQAQLPRQL